MEEIPIPTVETKRKHKPRTTNRFREDGTYDNKPCDPNYFRDYYRNKLSIKTACDICGKEVTKARLRTHKQSAVCQVFAYYNDSLHVEQIYSLYSDTADI